MTYDSEFPLEKIKEDKALLFLAGSIDLHLSGNWRQEVTNRLYDDYHFFDPTALNHATMSESQWNDHIKWELDAMERSNLILLNFLPDAKSPISLIELGLNAIGQKLIVTCPDSFYKKQYVQALCKRFSIPIFPKLTKAIEYVIDK